jgi:N-acyl-D-amino-acid deacylase
MFSLLEVAQEFQKIRQAGISINFATLVGHNTVRQAVMGSERRAPNADELSRMKELVRRAMSEWAIGFSTGLQYVPEPLPDETVAQAVINLVPVQFLPELA